MLVTIVLGHGEVLQSRFLLVKVVKGLILLHCGKESNSYGCLVISRRDYFCVVYLLNFSSYFILRSEKAMQLLSLMTSFLLFIRASLVKTNQHQQQHQSNKTKQIGSRKWHFD